MCGGKKGAMLTPPVFWLGFLWVARLVGLLLSFVSRGCGCRNLSREE